MRTLDRFTDRFCLALDQMVRSLANTSKVTGRPYPAISNPVVLNQTEKTHSSGLMRVNHTGEICAQALYHGQAIVSKAKEMKIYLEKAAIEEGDHLLWCKQRLDNLHSRPSYLNPFWYGGSFLIGAAAGLLGDDWSLGFIVETERQVMVHLEKHLNSLSANDEESRQIIQVMYQDEAEHQREALAKGGKILPDAIQVLMQCASKIMVILAYKI